MSVSIHPTIKDHWIILYSPFGRGKNPETGKQENRKDRIVYGPCTYETAKRYEESLRRKVGKVTVSVNPTFASIFVAFCGDYKLKVSATTYEDFQSAWKKHILPFFGHLHLNQVNSELGNLFKSKLLDGGLKHKTVNKIISYVGSILDYCKHDERRYCDKSVKLTGFSKKQIAPPPKQIPSIEEIDRLFAEIPLKVSTGRRKTKHLIANDRGDMIKLLYYGGLRLDEARTLTGEHVNLASGYFTVIGKGNKSRVVPLNDESRRILEQRVSGGLVFKNPKTGKGYIDLQKMLDTCCKKAGIRRITHHTLRHAFGTHMVMAGANLRSIQMLMGHATVTTTEMYTTLAQGFLSDEISRLNR